MDKIKLIFAFLLTVLSGAFLYERSKRKSAEAVADNHELLTEIGEGNKKKAHNDGLLESEEDKRKQIEKETQEAKERDQTLTDFFKKR